MPRLFASLVVIVAFTVATPSVADALLRARRIEAMQLRVPASLDTSVTQRAGTIEVSYRPIVVPLDVVHDWELSLRHLDGTPILGAGLAFSAVMPQHGHGLATEPRITEVGAGFYRAAGIRFQMPGWWSVALNVTEGDRDDSFVFNLLIETKQNSVYNFKSLILSPIVRPKPSRAAQFGAMLFHDRALSRRGDTACATCHVPQRAFSSSRLVPTTDDGPARSVPTLYGAALQSWFFWDGRKDSLWSQALAPLENPREHDLTRTEVVAIVRARYRQTFERTFGPIPADETKAFMFIGKALAAYEQTLTPRRAPFDVHAEANDFPVCEKKGLDLFVGKARCVSCHHGPMLRNDFFHNTGLTTSGLPHAEGRARGLERLAKDPFMCTTCAEVTHARKAAVSLLGAYKTPTLRDLKHTAPYMHDGRFRSLAEVIDHYNKALPGPDGDTELVPLDLTSSEKHALVCFLESLSAD